MLKQTSRIVPAVPAMARQGTEAPVRDWSWVEASVWTERMLAALVNGVQGGKWFSLMDKVYRAGTLRAAWQRVAGNRGAAGVDGQSVQRFALRAEPYLSELEEALKSGTYRPQPVKRVDIPKGGGKTRPLGIPVVKDRIVQTALKMVIEPIFESQFRAHSYGFRPGRGCKDALREVDGLIKAGYTHVVDADLAGYFDSIPKAALLQRVAEHISDGGVLGLVEAFLEQDVVKGLERWRPDSGTPQGAVMSPLLANLYLHPLDCLLEQRGYRMVRYADDFVVLCASAEQAQAALAEVTRWVAAHGLRLNADKTRVGDCTRMGEGFEFLGYRFEAGTRSVRRKSFAALRDKIRAQTGRSRSGSLRVLIDDLNPMLRGWFHYFKHIYPASKFFQLIDGFVRRRLRAILCRRHRRAHQFGRNLWASKKWPNVFLAQQGLFTMVEAYAAASQPR
jgi:RNA-directed DNA polymerase